MTPSVEDFHSRGFDSYPISLGDTLRGERATAGKSLEDVQTDLKIGAKYISAIEEGDLSSFETLAFIAGYVRSYARYLNLDADEAYKQFCLETRFGGIEPHISNCGTPSQNQRNSRISPGVFVRDTKVRIMGQITTPMQGLYEQVSFSAIGSLLVLMMLVTGFGYGGWRVLQEVQRVQFVPINETLDVASNISVLSNGGIAEDLSPSLTQTPGALSVSTLSLDRLYRPQELDVPNVVLRDGPIAMINPEQQGAFAPSATPLVLNASTQKHSPIAVVQQGPPSVDIVATRPAWVRVYLPGPDGSVLFEKILDAGKRYRLPNGLQGSMLKAGNPSAVYFMIGQKYYGPIGTNGGKTREVSLVQSDIETSYQEVLNLFSEPLASPLNVDSGQTTTAILNDAQSD